LELSNLVINDGAIKKMISKPGSLEVYFEDWQENTWSIVFEDVIAFESLGAEGEELSEIKVADTGEYKIKVLRLFPDESEAKCRIYSFVSAWSGLSVLQVLADKVTVGRMRDEL
jgi:hypothetical protein